MSRRVVLFASFSGEATPSERDTVLDLLSEGASALSGASFSHAALHDPLSVGGGDLTWDLAFESAPAADTFLAALKEKDARGLLAESSDGMAQAAEGLSDFVACRPEPMASHLGQAHLVGVKRTLWLRTLPETSGEAIGAFEQETPLLATAVPAIRNWCWSRIPAESFWSEGPCTRFSHLWEQEFDDFPGLEVDYMSAPFHWGFIDRWFDPEMPDRIVDLHLAHLACQETQPVLTQVLAAPVAP